MPFLSTLLIESAEKWHQSCSPFVAVLFIRGHCERSAEQWEAISWKNVLGRARDADETSRRDSGRLIELATVAEKWKANRISDVIPLSSPRGALLTTLQLRRMWGRPCSSSSRSSRSLWSEDTNSADCSLASSPLTRRCFDLPQSLIVPSYFCVNRHKRVASRCAFQFMLFPPGIHFVLLWGNASFRSHSTIYISDLNHHIWTTLWNIAARPNTVSHDFLFYHLYQKIFLHLILVTIFEPLEHRCETQSW